MGPKMRKVTRFAAAGLAALALSTGAEAAVVSYGIVGSDTGLLTAASNFIDVGVGAFSIDDTFILSVVSPPGSVVSSIAPAALQTVQGCAVVGLSCTAAGWFDLPDVPFGALNLGGTSFLASPGTSTTGTLSGHFDVPAGVFPSIPIASLRLKFNGDGILPAASTVTVLGSLTVTPVPEPGAWAMMLAGIIGVAGIARRRIG